MLSQVGCFRFHDVLKTKYYLQEIFGAKENPVS